MTYRSAATMRDLQTAFEFFDCAYPSPLPDALFARATSEGFVMTGYRKLTEQEKHDYCKRTTGFYATFLPPSLYQQAEAEGHDMTRFVVNKPMPTDRRGASVFIIEHHRFEPSDKPRWPCRGERKR